MKRDISHDWRALAIMAIIAAFAIMLLFAFTGDAAGPGTCHSSSAATLAAVDGAMQAVRYDRADAPQRMRKAERLARRDGVPVVSRRIRLARIYYRRGLTGLAKYHLWRAKHDANRSLTGGCEQ